MDVNFITENPAIAEFNRANKVADDQAQSELTRQKLGTEVEQGKFNLSQSQAEGPTRLRKLGAEADTAQVNAKFAAPQAQASLEQTRQSTQASIASMNNATARLHMDAFTRSIELLDQGNVDEARKVAASVGDTIPDAVVQNVQARSAIKQITAAAQRYFPGRPKDQMTYITSHLTELGAQQQQGKPINPQTAPYQPAPGAPEPQTTTSTGLKWGVTGRDEYDNATYGWIDPSTYSQGATAPSGAPAPGGASTMQPAAPGGPVPPAGAPTMQPAAPGAPVAPDPTAPTAPGQQRSAAPGGSQLASADGDVPSGTQPALPHGQAFLETLAPGDADLVKGIAENRINPSSLSVKGGHRERILKWVAQYKQDYNQTLYSGATAYQRTAGSAGARVEMATNEVGKAIPLALHASQNLPRGSFVPWNQLVQKWQAGTSDPAYYDFITKNMVLINAYMRAMNPQGVPRIAERLELHANNMLSSATDQVSYETQVRALWQETQQSRAAVAETRGGVGPSANDVAGGNTPMPGGGASQQTGPLPRVNSPDEARSMPSGTHFLDPNGVERVVP